MQHSGLLRYSILSSLVCLASFVLVRVTDTTILSVFLRLNNIYHEYSFFHIDYMPGGQHNWTEGKVIFIYTVPYVVFALLGIYLPHFFRYTKSLWLHLSVTWLSFHLLLAVMAGLAAGIFQYRGPGVALEWLFVNMPVKIIGVMIMLIILFVAARRFGWYFLRKVPNPIYQDDFDDRHLWFNKVLLIPFLACFVLIFPLSELETWLNFVFSFMLGLVFIAVVYRTIPLVYIVTSN